MKEIKRDRVIDLYETKIIIDNLFADLWKHMDMKARLNRIGIPKYSGAWAGVLSDDFCMVESGLDWHACLRGSY